LWLIGLIGLTILLTIAFLYRQLLVVAFDPVLAATLRFRPELLRNVLLILIALTVVASLQTVGVGLVSAMLVTPAATAYLLTRRLLTMMLVAAGIGAFSSVFGLYLSFYANVVSGAAIVLTATAVFFVVFLLNPRRRFLRRRPVRAQSPTPGA
jgi:ABC-type Mn2+/Zn2+ transport system permease subunit